MRKKSEHTESIVRRHDDDIAAREPIASVERRGCRPVLQAAAVNPHHHGQLAAAGVPRSPDVEVQAVLTLSLGGRVLRIASRLHADGREVVCLSNAAPGRDGLGRAPTQLSDRRRGERNTAENRYAVGFDALHRSAFRSDPRLRRLCQRTAGKDRRDDDGPCHAKTCHGFSPFSCVATRRVRVFRTRAAGKSRTCTERGATIRREARNGMASRLEVPPETLAKLRLA